MAGGPARAPTQAAAAAGIKGSRRAVRGTAGRRRHRHPPPRRSAPRRSAPPVSSTASTAPPPAAGRPSPVSPPGRGRQGAVMPSVVGVCTGGHTRVRGSQPGRGARKLVLRLSLPFPRPPAAGRPSRHAGGLSAQSPARCRARSGQPRGSGRPLAGASSFRRGAPRTGS